MRIKIFSLEIVIRKDQYWGKPTVIEAYKGHYLYLYPPTTNSKGEIDITVASNIGGTRIHITAGTNVSY